MSGGREINAAIPVTVFLLVLVILYGFNQRFDPIQNPNRLITYSLDYG